MLDLLFTTAYAEPAAQEMSQSAALISSMVPFVIMIVIFYFLLIRPQKKQEKKTKEMLASLQVGDKVITVGGICGKISKLKDDVVYIETGFVGNPNERSVVKMERSAIKTVQTIHEEQA